MDTKIWVTTKQWEDGEVKIGEKIIYLPPTPEKTQTQLRHKRKIGYTKSGGKVFYLLEDIYKYLERSKVSVA